MKQCQGLLPQVFGSFKALGSIVRSQNFQFKSVYSLFMSNTPKHVTCRVAEPHSSFCFFWSSPRQAPSRGVMDFCHTRADTCFPWLRWHIARKSECTAQCGLGYRTLEIYCSKYSRLEGKIEKVDDRFCSSQPKPSTREKCTGDCNVGGWRYSAWTEVRDAQWCGRRCLPLTWGCQSV